MNSPVTARPPGRSRLALILAGVLALLGSFVVTAHAQAGYYDDSNYGSYPCSYRCGYGYSPYRYAPYRSYQGCSACGCGRRCNSISRPGLLYERRYVEREYVERRYGWPARHYRRHYGYYPYGGYRSWSRPYPWGYGGVRGWRAPYSYRYEPSADRYEEPLRPPVPVWESGYGWRAPHSYQYQPSADRYEEPPRPPAPVWDGAGYEAVPDGYENAR
jgi:hypothetical protein